MLNDATGAGAPYNLADKVMELFPDGPPDDTVREAVINAEITSLLGGTGNASNIVTIDNKKKYHVKAPVGFDVDAQQSRNGWNVVFSSPTALGGSRIRRQYLVAGGKAEAMYSVYELVNDFTTVKLKMEFLVRQWEGKADSEVPAAFVPAREQMDDEDCMFDGYYTLYKKAESRQAHVDFKYLDIKSNQLSSWQVIHSGGINHVEFLASVAMHAIWIERYQKRLGGQLEMAKNNGGTTWWKLTGSPKNIEKARKTLNKKSHLVVEGKGCLYLYIQYSEVHFVDGFKAGNSLHAKMVEEPEYHTTLCGKRQTNDISEAHHASRCNSCKRERANEELAEQATRNTEAIEPVPDFRGKKRGSTRAVEVTPRKADKLVAVSPRNVNKLLEAEYQKRNGAVITIQGPQETKEDDYQAKAKEARRVADDLMEQSLYWEKLAERYEAMDKPTKAVQEAEAAMAEAVRKAQEAIDAAKAKEEADRLAQAKELEALIASGPPA